MNRTIVVSRRSIVLLLMVMAVAAVTVAWPRLSGPIGPEHQGDPGQAAVAFVGKFYAVDYRDQQAWLAALAPLATVEGQALLEQNLAVLLWPQLASGQAVVSAAQVSVADKGIALEGRSQLDGGSAWQVRSVAVTLADDAAWPNMPSGAFTAYVMLRQEAGQWKFSTFMSEAQVTALRQSPTVSQ